MRLLISLEGLAKSTAKEFDFSSKEEWMQRNASSVVMDENVSVVVGTVCTMRIQ